ncbi:16926_t:CDS:2, partial [Racocetra persica]
DNGTFNNCSAYITQPTLNPVNGQYTGKFDPKDLSFPTNQISECLKRIFFKFDVINDTIVDRHNATYYKLAVSEFMIDPNDFVVNTQTEIKNKSALYVMSNILAMEGALLALDTFLFGARPINP